MDHSTAQSHRSDQTSSTQTLMRQAESVVDGDQDSQHKEDVHGEPDIDRLPLEIITYIFELYLKDMADCRWLPQRGAFPIIGAVCARWRRIAWSTPQLWNNLFFVLAKNTTASKVELAIEWLSRSGEVALSISLHSSRNLAQNESIIFPLIDAINETLSRCRHLDIYQISVKTVSRLSFTKPSLLQSLKLALPEDNTAVDLGPHAAPTAVSIQGIHLDFLVIKWTNLTTFVAIELYLNEVFDILLQAPGIKSINLMSITMGTISMPPERYGELVHSQIDTLQFRASDREPDSRAMCTFLQKSTFPKVKHCIFHTFYTFPVDVFYTFLCRSSCTLTSLTIHDSGIRSEDIFMILKILPVLSSFFLDYTACYTDEPTSLDEFFNALCQDTRYIDHNRVSTDTTLLPSIEEFTVINPCPFPWAWIPGFRDRRSYNGETCTITPVRPHLKQIFISRTSYATDGLVRDDKLCTRRRYLPSSLIESWGTFLELLELQESVQLSLNVENAEGDYNDLFDSSFLKLKGTLGEPPQHIGEAESFRSWVKKWEDNDNDDDDDNDDNDDNDDDDDDDDALY